MWMGKFLERLDIIAIQQVDIRFAAHNGCNIIAIHSNFSPIVMHHLSVYDSQPFLKELVDRKNPKAQFKIIPKTNEIFAFIRYGC